MVFPIRNIEIYLEKPALPSISSNTNAVHLNERLSVDVTSESPITLNAMRNTTFGDKQQSAFGEALIHFRSHVCLI